MPDALGGEERAVLPAHSYRFAFTAHIRPRLRIIAAAFSLPFSLSPFLLRSLIKCPPCARGCGCLSVSLSGASCNPHIILLCPLMPLLAYVRLARLCCCYCAHWVIGGRGMRCQGFGRGFCRFFLGPGSGLIFLSREISGRFSAVMLDWENFC